MEMFNLNDVYGFNELIQKLKGQGVSITPVDISIANTICTLCEQTAIKEPKDLDGIKVKRTVGFLYSKEIEGVLNLSPNAAQIILNLEDLLYTEHRPDMYTYELIQDVKGMTEVYLSKGNIAVSEDGVNKPVYSSRKEYQRARWNGYNTSSSFGSGEEIPQENINYNGGMGM